MSVLFAILLFSLLIFVHEFGHFAAAKLSGVQVNEFSMFMGPALWKKQIGETLYSVRLIPHDCFSYWPAAIPAAWAVAQAICRLKPPV